MSDRGYRGRGNQGGGYNQRHGGGNNRNRHSGEYRAGGQDDYHDRRQQQQRSAHQRSFVGQKRGREHVEYDPKIQLVKQLLKLGEPGEGGNDRVRTPADTVLAASQAFSAALGNTSSDHRQLQQLLLDAVCGCPHKTALYAHLAGLLNVDHSAWVGQLVQLALGQLASGLAGPAASPAPRLLLRFLALLPAMGVVTQASLVQLLSRILEVAAAAAHSGAAVDSSGGLWQPWADFLVYTALSALPWCGADLVVAAGGELQQVLAAAEVYMGLRPQQEDPLLRPYYGAASAADAADAGDSGGASFLPSLLQMLQACQEEQAWQVRCLEAHHLVHEQQLARNIPVDMPPLDLPPAPPALATMPPPGDPIAAAAAAAALRAAYPPRGGLTLFDRALLSHKEGQEPTDTELFVGEEWIMDLVTTYDGHRAQLAQVLATGLPLIGAQGALLAQVLLGQLLRLPASPLPTCAYVTLIVDLCKLMPVFAKYYAGGVRRLFERCDYLDPQLRALLATALAHHVSNFSWLWPWDRFKGVLSQEPAAAQRGWVMLAMSHMVRLSDYDTMRKVLEANHMQDYVPLLGDVPVVHLVPQPQAYPPAPGMADVAASTPAPAAGAAAATPEAPAANGQAAARPVLAGQPSDVLMADVSQAADAPEAMDTSADAAQAADAGSQPPAPATDASPQPRVDEPVGEDAEALWAGRLLATLTSRKPAPGAGPSGRQWGGAPAAPTSVPVTYEDVVAWMEASQMRTQLGEPLPLLRAVVRALLSAAAKSLTHIHVLLERYAPLLRETMEAVGPEQGVPGLLQLVGAMYVDFPSRLHTVLEKLVLLGVVTVPRLVSWCVMEWPAFVLGPSSQPVASALAWEVLDVTLGDAAARKEEAEGSLQQAEARLQQAQSRLADAITAAEELAAQTAAAAAEADPGDGAEGEQPGGVPLSRQLQVGAVQQEAVAALEAAQQAKAAAQQTLEELQQSLIGGLQQALSGLAQRLSQLGEVEEAGRQLAWAQVRAFIRGQAPRYLMLAGPQLQQLAGELAPGEVRDALLGPLGLRGLGEAAA